MEELKSRHEQQDEEYERELKDSKVGFVALTSRYRIIFKRAQMKILVK